MIIAPSWQWTSASWFAYVCTYCWFSIKYFSFCLFQSWMSPFSLWSSSEPSYIFVTISTPGHVFLNLYIFWTVQQPLGFSAPIVKSEYNLTNGGYGTPQKMPFPWIYKTNLQQSLRFFYIYTAIEVFLHLPNFLPSRNRLWANFDEICLWINICDQPSTKRKRLNVEP